MIKLLKQIIRSWAGRHPFAFYLIYPLKHKNRRLCVNNSTEIVIEGYPRSANTFSVVAFESAQDKHIEIAHHLHVPAQIMKGVQKKLPTVVLIREPESAISSLLVRHPHLDVELCIKDYINFYESVYDLHNDFVVAEFNEVTNNYKEIILRLNAKFGTAFNVFENTGNNVNNVFEKVDTINVDDNGSETQVARPNEIKNELKSNVKKMFEEHGVRVLMDKAQLVYNNYLNLI